MKRQYSHSSAASTTKLNFGSVEIDEYPRILDDLGFAHFKVKGRRPDAEGKAYLESACNFVLYVIEGSATMRINRGEISINKGDLVTVCAGTPWSLKGDVEYVVASTPPFSADQVQEVDEVQV